MRISKLEIAERELNQACDLFAKGADDISIICLAGAAEEILGKLASRAGLTSAYDHFVEYDRKHFGGRAGKIVNQELNGVRNALKHANDANEDEVEILPGEAGAMIMRALMNWARLGKEPSTQMAFAYQKIRQHMARSNPSFKADAAT